MASMKRKSFLGIGVSAGATLLVVVCLVMPSGIGPIGSAIGGPVHHEADHYYVFVEGNGGNQISAVEASFIVPNPTVVPGSDVAGFVNLQYYPTSVQPMWFQVGWRKGAMATDPNNVYLYWEYRDLAGYVHGNYMWHMVAVGDVITARIWIDLVGTGGTAQIHMKITESAVGGQVFTYDPSGMIVPALQEGSVEIESFSDQNIVAGEVIACQYSYTIPRAGRNPVMSLWNGYQYSTADSPYVWERVSNFDWRYGTSWPGATVTLQSPANGAVGVSLTPTLTWSAPPGADYYQVRLEVPGVSSRTYTSSTTSYVPPTLSSSTRYNWNVRASPDNGVRWGPWLAEPWSFTTNVPPTASFTTNTWCFTVNVDGGASRDSDGTISEFRWNWGDGQTTIGTIPTAAHSYTSEGPKAGYTITLTVVDNNGATAQASNVVKPVRFQLATTAYYPAPQNRWEGVVKLVDATGAPMVGQTVLLQYSTNGKTWRFARGTFYTDGSGQAYLGTSALAGTYLRVIYQTENLVTNVIVAG